MKYFGFLLYFLLPLYGISQTTLTEQETYPKFPECENSNFPGEESCFKNTLGKFVIENFELPQIVLKENYKGEVFVLFEVNRQGEFKVLYVDAVYPELKEEVLRVFAGLPIITPASYNGRATYAQFRMPLKIPLEATPFPVNKVEEPVKEVVPAQEPAVSVTPTPAPVDEYEAIVSLPFKTRQNNSNINIPLSHERYSRFDAAINQIGTNTHTASKPFLFKDVAKYYDFEEEQASMARNASTWVGRKIWNEHLITFQGENYWFTGDVVLDLQLGREQNGDYDFTYNNTRGAIFQGGLGKNLSFYTVVFESQGRFANYYNSYAESLAPFAGSGVAIIPGRGIAKSFMEGGYDYPVAEGYLSYSPSEFFDVQLGHGNQFIGDGYRSLLISDNPNPYPYLKLQTTFWKLQYTNTWMSLRDVREEVAAEGSYRTKYMANHYLSINLTKRLNIGLFESVVWQDDNGRGFDVNYLNPVIFYRAIEFSTGARGGNALVGLSSKYKVSNSLNLYGQWIIDEFSSNDVFGGEGSWKNKLGYQLGIKYFNAFNVEDLILQAEYNQVRPYTYSHNSVVLNYGHNNQSMAHLWGANFREILGIARYRKDRMYGTAKFILGERGFDFNSPMDNAYYGGDIYRSERERAFESGVKIAQGNTTTSIFTEVETGYIVNPVTNLKVFASMIYRNFDPLVNTPQHFDINTLWFNIGLRTDIFNWYFDY